MEEIMIKKIINVMTLKEYFTLLGILVKDAVLKNIKTAENIRMVLDAYSYQIFKRNQLEDYTEFMVDEAAIFEVESLTREEFDLSESYSSLYLLYEPNDVSDAFESNDKIAYIKTINVFAELPN